MIQVYGPVENAAGLHPAVEDRGQQWLDVSAGRGGGPMSWYGCRSLPHTQARTIRTNASLGFSIMGSGPLITRISPTP